MKSIAELEQIREKALKSLSLRKDGEAFKIVVGMATCGIAAGARDVMHALLEELNKADISNVKVTMTGCMGVCKLEPIVEVINHEGTKVTYVNMDAQKIARVVKEHILNGNVCSDITINSAESK